MRKVLFSLFLSALSVLVFVMGANADVLCVKKSQKAKNDKVNLAGAFKIVSGSTCDSGYTALLDTSVFKGDKGDTGATGATGATGTKGDTGTAAISSSTCVKREAEAVDVLSSSDETAAGISATCNSGEYAHAAVQTTTQVFSSDYTDEDCASPCSNAGQTFTSELVERPNILESDLFLVGFQSNDDEITFTNILTGTRTYTQHIDLTCCQRGS